MQSFLFYKISTYAVNRKSQQMRTAVTKRVMKGDNYD